MNASETQNLLKAWSEQFLRMSSMSTEECAEEIGRIEAVPEGESWDGEPPLPSLTALLNLLPISSLAEHLQAKIEAVNQVLEPAYPGYLDGYELTSTGLELRYYYRHCSSCDADTETVYLPYSYLQDGAEGARRFLEKAEERKRREEEARRHQEALRKAEQAMRAAQIKEAAERAEYERLKAKFDS